MKGTRYLFRRTSSAVSSPGNHHKLLRSLSSRFSLEESEDSDESVRQVCQTPAPRVSLAKSLACLTDDTSTDDKRKPRTRMELKRSIEVRIKKRVKEQFSNGKFHDLMNRVIARADTLQDAYDIIRLNSNVDLSLKREDLCFVSLAEKLAGGNFEIEGNTFSTHLKSGRKECLFLPNVKLKVIQEAIRVTLEIVYRPHFSKISHGCRSGRGHMSALKYICREVRNPNWWFTLNMNKEADGNILSKLISTMEEKIDDACLFSFINRLFDTGAINLVFGSFPKGHGLPQEGILSPILMNIYLDSFDREVFRLCMRYEGLGSDSSEAKDGPCSNLRQWMRRQMKDSDHSNTGQPNNITSLRIYVCRYMDEVFISISGSKDVAVSVKAEIVDYLNSLHLNVEDRGGVLASDNPSGLQFLGTVLRMTVRETDTVRAVHKLKDKVQLFASQKRDIWDAGTVRIGMKWLAYGLRRLKESEIKQLQLSTVMLDHISQFRKDGMKTDHWFKSLVKIWMQDMNAKAEANEEVVLSKYIAEPSLPQDLRDSYYNFQKLAKEYVSSETATTMALLPCSSANLGSSLAAESTITRMEAPISFLAKSLHRYGLINIRGFPRHVSALVLLDDILIINWFSGLVLRWLKWYSEFDNFEDIKLAIIESARKSCIRTLASKHVMHESIIEKRFETELSVIPMAEEFDSGMRSIMSDSPVSVDDEALMYGITYTGLCLLSLSRVKVPCRTFNCFVMGCCVPSPSMYILNVKERQMFPGWKTGFATAIHPSLNGKRVGLCNQHVKDLFLGHISLQSIEFGALSR